MQDRKAFSKLSPDPSTTNSLKLDPRAASKVHVSSLSGHNANTNSEKSVHQPPLSRPSSSSRIKRHSLDTSAQGFTPHTRSQSKTGSSSTLERFVSTTASRRYALLN